MTIRFEILFDTIAVIGKPTYAVKGTPLYIIKDRSFYYDVESCYVPTVHLSCFAIDTIQLHVNVDTYICVYADGYHPYSLWEPTSLQVPDYSTGILLVHSNDDLLVGIGYGMEDTVPSTSWFDVTNGWWCIGIKEYLPGSQAVEFATGCVAVVMDQRLVSLWIKADNWSDVAALLTNTRCR
jgi:hypothetical protein